MTTPRSDPTARPDAAADPRPDTRPDTRTSPSGPPPPVTTGRYDFLAPSQAADEIGRLGPYRVLEVLGRGGMGLVFRAEDSKLRRFVALKVMLPQVAADPNARLRFIREGRAAAAVEHDHIIPIYQADEDRGVPFIAMPLLRGRTLADYLKSHPQPPVLHALQIARQMADGLAAAHEKGLIHRDIKPGNVWLEAPSGRVKLLDFGLARPETTAESDGPRTAPGAVLGTPSYMAPEQAAGRPTDARSDLFSLGVVLYEMATGELPFKGMDVFAVLLALATATPPPPLAKNPALPPALSDLIERLLAKDPDARPPSAAAVAAELRRIKASLSTTVPLAPAAAPAAADPWASIAAAPTEPDAAPPPPRPAAARRGGPPAWAWAALGLLVLGGGGLLLLQVISFTTPRGTLVIDSSDPDVEVVVRRDGAVLIDRTKQREIELKVGDYGIELAEKKDGLKLSTNRFEITKNGKATVTVTLEKKDRTVVAEGPKAGIGGSADKPPSPAGWQVLFDGKDASQWQSANGGPVPWDVRDGYLDATPGAGTIHSRELFGDYELHLEYWLAAAGGKGNGKGANSGVYLQGKYEVQIVEDDGLPPSATGSGALFGRIAPTRNVSKPPGEWQTLDITFTAPKGNAAGRLTVVHNGIKTLDGVAVKDPPTMGARPELARGDRGPLMLQTALIGRVRFRDIRVRPLGEPPDSDRQAAEILKPYTGRLIVRLRSGPVNPVRLGSPLPAGAAAVRRGDPLPAEPFDLVALDGFGDAPLPADFVTATLLPAVSRLRSLEGIWEWGSDQRLRLSAADLAALADTPAGNSLAQIHGPFEPTADVVAALNRFPRLEAVGFRAAGCDDAMLENLRALSRHIRDRVAFYDLGAKTAVGDRGLAAITSLRTWGLSFQGGRGFDRRFGKAVAGMPALGGLLMTDTPDCGDDTVAELAASRSLGYLYLGGTGLTDAGLDHLTRLATLTALYARRTKVTKAGVEKLAAALPRCRIDWDGGTVMPQTAADPDRKAAELLRRHPVLLKLRLPSGKVEEFWPSRPLPAGPFAAVEIVYQAGEPLPADYATAVFLPTVAELRSLAAIQDWWHRLRMTEADLDRLAGLPVAAGLETVDARAVKLTPQILPLLKRFPRLTGFGLDASEADDGLLVRLKGEFPPLTYFVDGALGKSGKVTPKGMAVVTGFPLRILSLSGSPLVDRDACRAFAAMPELTQLYLVETGVDDDGAAELGKCRKLTSLTVPRTRLSDAGLAHLAGLTNLTYLDVSGTRATAAGVKKLAAALPRCMIVWDGGTIGPTPAAPAPPPNKLAPDPAVPLLAGHDGPVWAVRFLADGKRVLSAGWDGTVRVWDADTGQQLKVLSTNHNDKRLTGLAVSPDERLVASGGSYAGTFVWNLADGKRVRLMPFDRKGIRAVAFTPDGERLVVGTGDGTLGVFRVRDGELLHSAKLFARGSITGLQILPDGKTVAASADLSADVILWDSAEGKEVRRLHSTLAHVGSLALDAEGERVFVSGPAGGMRVLDVQTGKEVHSMTRHKSHVKGLHPLPGGRLVSTSDDGTVRLWDVAAGKEIDRIDAGGPVVAWSGVSPDGRRLAAGAGWRVTTEMERTGDYRLRLVRLPPPPGPAFFNGKDLTGWVSASGTWKVADGELVGGGGRAANRSVVTARTYTDFEIAFRVKRTAGGGNPSFLFRAPPPDKDGRFVNGPRLMFNQATIVLNRNVDGIQNQGKGGVPLRPGEFNEVTVRCVGKRLTVTANGQAVTDGEFDIPADGVIGWQTPPKGGELTVRDIRFTDLGKAAADPDRAAAEWLLARGGRIGVSSPTTGYHDVTADKGGTLPAGPFRLNSFMLPGPQFMADADLARFRGLAALDTVALSGAAVTDAGVEHLATLPLTHLYLSRTKVTDAGLRHLKACDRLKVLHLDDTAVTDAGLAHLTGLTRLTGLRLDRAKVTKAGVEKLAAALPGCRIDWSGGAIEPTPAAVPK